MWWDTLPSFAIVGVCFCMPSILVYATNRFFLGTPYKRYLDNNEKIHLYLRDMRISGNRNPYNQKGLENLSDEEVNS